jgi:hypothetical protein
MIRSKSALYQIRDVDEYEHDSLAIAYPNNSMIVLSNRTISRYRNSGL